MVIVVASNSWRAGLSGSVAQTGDQEVAGLIPYGSGKNSFIEIDHEIFSMVILSLALIQERQLSISGKRMCTSTG